MKTGAVPRSRIVRACLRSVVTIVVVIAGYYAVPLGGPRTVAAGVRFAIAVAVLVAVMGLSIRSVLRSEHPMLRAAETIALVVPLTLVGFASAYGVVSDVDSGAFSEVLDHTGALYFTMATVTTVGYGDIAASSDAARIVVMVQMVANVAVIGLSTRALLAAAKSRRRDGPVGAR